MIIAVIGLGYVGLPLAAALNKKHRVIGFDINSTRIEELNEGIDRNGEEDDFENITFTDDPNLFYRNPDVYIVCVPTPVGKNKKPNLSYLISACDSIVPSLKSGALIINESTVYPGVTENVMKEWIEFKSDLKFGFDFQLGYSPERINPGDKTYHIKNVTKIISATNEEAIEKMKEIYSFTDTFVAESIQVAEASKVLENTQRDVNIALMNEMAVLFDKTRISTKAVLDCCKTKWNFLDFKPGLVGGHCIGVDPYYISHFAKENNWKLDLVDTARFINDNYLVTLITSVVVDKGYRSVGIMGVTFKKNVPDIRNSLIFKLAKNIRRHNINVFLADPLAIIDDIEKEGEYLLEKETVEKLSDVLIKAVDHDWYKHFSSYKDVIDLTQTIDPVDCVWSL